MPTANSPPTCFMWTEIGRATLGGGDPWIVWMAQIGDSGALYRTQIIADSRLTVTVDLVPNCGAPARPIHRASCEVPPDTEAVSARVRRLIDAADEATRIALTRSSRDDLRLSVGVSADKDASSEPVLTGHRPATKPTDQYDQSLQGP
jgi:hypothetical protein